MEDNFAKIQDVARKLNLRFKNKIEDQPVHHEGYFTALCFDGKGGKYIFKANITNDAEVIDSLKKQIIFFKSLPLNIFAEIEKRVGNINIQKIFHGAVEEDGFCWLVINYSSGEICGNWFAFNGKYLNDQLLEALSGYPEFIKIISDNLKNAFLRNLILEKKDYRYYIYRFKKENKKLDQIFEKGAFKFLEEEIEKNKKLIDKKAVEIIHRDDHPKNLLFDKKTGKITVIDWSDLSFGNYMYDVSDFWMHAWPDRKWQEKYFKKIIEVQKNREEAIKLFKLNAIRSIYEELEHLASIGFVRQDRNIPKNQFKKFQKQAIKANLVSLDFVMKL